MNTRIRELIWMGLVLATATGSYFVGRGNTASLLQVENERVVSAIARTMRCQTEAEYVAGEDHQCTADEIRQDAGL